MYVGMRGSDIIYIKIWYFVARYVCTLWCKKRKYKKEGHKLYQIFVVKNIIVFCSYKLKLSF